MQNYQISNIRKIIYIAAIVIILASIVCIWQLSSNSGKRDLKVMVAPKGATVTIDNKKVDGRSTIRLRPGEYDYSVSKDHFITKNGSIDVENNDHNILSVSIYPSDDLGKDIAKYSEQDYYDLEGEAGKRAVEKGTKFYGNNPIAKKLPYQGLLFSIGYKLDKSDPTEQTIILTIRSTPSYYSSAIVLIRSWGFDPTEFNIEIVNEESPFK